VSLDVLLDAVGPSSTPPSWWRSVTSYTTNIPLGDLVDGQAWSCGCTTACR
jgi:hypothetical protein